MSPSRFKLKNMSVTMLKSMVIVSFLSTLQRNSELIGKREISKIIMGYHR